MAKRKTASDTDEAETSRISLSQDLMGLEDAATALLQSFHSGRQHHAILLAGPRGIGKASLAYQFARHVLDVQRPLPEVPEPSLLLRPIAGKAANLVTERSHPDFLSLSRERSLSKGAKTSISVEDTRTLLPFLGARPALGAWRVVVIDGAEDMNRSAANAVLKSLEEPPANTIFLLVSHSPGRLLPTIRSRCLVVSVRELEEAAVAAICRRELPEAEEGALADAARLSGGSVAKALDLLQGNALKLNADMLALLEQLPNIPRQDLSSFADQFKGPEGREAFIRFTDSLLGLLSRLIGAGSALTNQEKRIAQALLPQGELEPLARLWETISKTSLETTTLNLDRKQAARSLFHSVEREAAKALASETFSFSAD